MKNFRIHGKKCSTPQFFRHKKPSVIRADYEVSGTLKRNNLMKIKLVIVGLLALAATSTYAARPGAANPFDILTPDAPTLSPANANFVFTLTGTQTTTTGG